MRRAHLKPRQRGGGAVGVPLHDAVQVAYSGRALRLGGQRERAREVEHGRRVREPVGPRAQPARVRRRAPPGQLQDLRPLALRAGWCVAQHQGGHCERLFQPCIGNAQASSKTDGMGSSKSPGRAGEHTVPHHVAAHRESVCVHTGT